MKDKLLILALCVFISIAASVTTSRMIVQPAKPLKEVVLFADGFPENVAEKANSYIKNGWTVKETSQGASGRILIVMAKY